MQKTQQLLERLEAIGKEVQDTGSALALLGLGSVGVETDRLDEYSDLDFFVIVTPGLKARFIDRLDWLTTVCPLAYVFRNSVDGYKVLFEDGIFCEFAVFEASELRTIPFTAGRLIWKDEAFDDTVCVSFPKEQRVHLVEGSDEWHLGEALTNLYIGLGRVLRGEKLTGTRFIQNYAIDHLLALTKTFELAQRTADDPFNPERRYEIRYPQTAHYLPTFIQGYERNIASALAILAFLEQHFAVNPAMNAAIRDLCARG